VQIQSLPAYIPLEGRAKKGTLIGVYLLWAYRVLFAFLTPVTLPVVMEGYGMMGLYAIQAGIASLLGCITVTIGGKLGDRFGRRKILMWMGYPLVILSALCTFHLPGPVFFVVYIASRFFDGILGSYHITILADVSSGTERPSLVGIYGTINAVGLVAGMLAGGFIADYLDPFLGFALCAPVGFLGMILLTCYYPNKPSSEPVPIDKMGIILMSCGVSSILAWCFFGGVLFPRVSALGNGLIALGVILLWALIRVEKRIKDPVFDLELFRNRAFTQSFLACLLISPMPQFCSTAIILFGSLGLGLSSTVTSTLALPKNLVFCFLPALLSGWLGKDYRRFRPIFLACGMTTAVGCVIAFFWDVSTPVLVIYLTMLLFGVSTSCQSTAIQLNIQVYLPQERMGVASAMVSFGGSIGGALFSAVYNIVYNARYAWAMEMGGGVWLSQAVTEVFSAIAVLTGVCGGLIVVHTLILIPREKKQKM